MPPSDSVAVTANPSRLEIDFHPAGLEMLRTIPSPLGRVLLWGVCLFALLALIWSLLGTVDVVAVGQGR